MTEKEVKEIQYSLPKSPDKKDIIEWLIKSHFVENYIIKLCSNNDVDIVDDVIQEIYLMLCEIPQERWDEITYQGYGAIKAYTSGLICRQVVSNTSIIYNKFKKCKKIEYKVSPDVWKIYDKTNKAPQINEFYDNDGKLCERAAFNTPVKCED